VRKTTLLSFRRAGSSIMLGFFANFAEVLAHFAVKGLILPQIKPKSKFAQEAARTQRPSKSGHSPALLPLDNLSLLELNFISE
jgi:hypothetical protein